MSAFAAPDVRCTHIVRMRTVFDKHARRNSCTARPDQLPDGITERHEADLDPLPGRLRAGKAAGWAATSVPFARWDQRAGTRTSSTTWMTPLVAAMFAATIVGVVSPPVVLIAPLALTWNDWPRSVSIVLLWPA